MVISHARGAGGGGWGLGAGGLGVGRGGGQEKESACNGMQAESSQCDRLEIGLSSCRTTLPSLQTGQRDIGASGRPEVLRASVLTFALDYRFRPQEVRVRHARLARRTPSTSGQRWIDFESEL